jgi:tetratricopeptide (TPR) repeat protein
MPSSQLATFLPARWLTFPALLLTFWTAAGGLVPVAQAFFPRRFAQLTPLFSPAQTGETLHVPVDVERDRPAALRGERERHLAGISLDQLLTGLNATPSRPSAKELAIRRDLTEYLIAYYRRQAAADPTARSPRQHLAFLHLILGDTLEQLDEGQSAITAFQRAAEWYGQLTQEPGGHNLQRYEAYVWHRLGAAHQKNDQPALARAAYDRALTLRQALVTGQPQSTMLRLELASTHVNRGLLLEQSANLEEAAAAQQAAISLLQQLTAKDQRQLEYAAELARALRHLARIRHKQGQPAEAKGEFSRAVQLQEQVVQLAPQIPDYRRDLALTHFLLSVVHHQNGNRQDALQACRVALEQQRQLVDQHPGEMDYQAEFARSWYVLGVVEQQGEAVNDALAAFRQALSLQENLVRQAPGRVILRLDLAATHHSIAVAYHRVGQRQQAKSAYEQARILQEKLFSEAPQAAAVAAPLAYTLHNLGIWHAQELELEKALTCYRRAEELRLRLAEAGDTMAREALAGTQICLASALRDQQDWATARPLYDRALAALEQLQMAGKGSRDLRWWLRNGYWGRAVLLDRLGQHTDAVQDWDRALAEQEKLTDDPGHELAALRLFRSASAIAAGAAPDAALAQIRALTAGQRSRWAPNFAAAQVWARLAAKGASQPVNQSAAWAAEAVACLRQARRAGYFVTKSQVHQLVLDPVWQPLRDRPDFQEFQRSLRP